MFLSKKIILTIILSFLMGVFLVLLFGLMKNNKMAPLEISFLDIGQGDAILVNYLHQYQILIDGGPSGKKVLTELSKVMPFGDSKIEVVIVTHPDRDHFVGLIDVIKKYDIGLILDNGQDSDDEVWQKFQKIIFTKHIPKKTVIEGSYMQLKNTRKKYDLKFQFFNPDKIAPNKKVKNNNSVVVRMDYSDNSFLFTGDAGFDSEADMIFDEESIDVDWLKVGHHGSKYSSSDFFLSRVTPKHSIISVGENDYGHPTEEVISRLQKIGSNILRTDELKTITIKCNDSCSL